MYDPWQDPTYRAKQEMRGISMPYGQMAASYSGARDNPRPADLGEYQSIMPSRLYRQPGSGPSPWLSMAEKNQRLDESQLQQGAALKSNADASQAMNRLAMTRGLSSGAQERLASEGAQNASNLWAKIGAEGMGARGKLGIQDEDWNRGNQRLDYQAEMQDKAAKNLFDLERYKEKMRAWGAGETAAAQENAGKK